MSMKGNNSRSRSESQSRNLMTDELPKEMHESVGGGGDNKNNSKPGSKSHKKGKDIDVMKEENDKGSFVLITILNLLLYILYITVVCIITFGTRSSGSYYMSKVIYESIIDAEFAGYAGTVTTFRTSATIDDFWEFADTVMLRGIYRDDWHWLHHPYIKDPLHLPTIAYMTDNRLVGRARLRQIRMVRDTCPVSKLVPLLARRCYPEYDESKEDAEPFHRILANKDGWNYHKEGDYHGRPVTGSLSTYSGAGFVILLDSNSQDTREQLIPFKNNLWIGRPTRAVFLDFTFFNPNIDVFCTVSLTWEIPATGGMTTSWNIQTIQLVRYASKYQQGILVCQIAFVILSVFYLLGDFINMFRRGFAEHFSDMWTYVTIAISIITVFGVEYNFHRYYTVNQAVEDMIIEADKYVDFQHLAYYESVYNDMTAVGIFLVWIKLFKYLSFNSSMLQLSGTLARCAKDIGGFGLIFLIVFFAFAQLGYTLFGKQVYGFSTFGRSIFTLLQFILGEVDYREIEDANRVLGPLFFLAFILFVFIILVNMFLAIINDSYHAVREEIELRGNQIERKDCVAAFCCWKNSNEDQKIRVAPTVDDIHIDPSEIRSHLKGQHFTEVEIEMFFARFDVDEDDTLNADEGHKLLSDLQTNTFRTKNKKPYTNHTNVSKPDLPDYVDHKRAKDMARAEANEIKDRIGVIESTVVELYPKLDSVLGRTSEYYDQIKRQQLADRDLKQSQQEYF